MSKRKSRDEFKQQVTAIIEEHGTDKAPRELCRAGLAVSHAEARRYVRHFKIDNGEKKLRH